MKMIIKKDVIVRILIAKKNILNVFKNKDHVQKFAIVKIAKIIKFQMFKILKKIKLIKKIKSKMKFVNAMNSKEQKPNLNSANYSAKNNARMIYEGGAVNSGGDAAFELEVKETIREILNIEKQLSLLYDKVFYTKGHVSTNNPNDGCFKMA